MLFCIGNLDDVLNSDAPYLFLFTNTNSVGVALLLTVILFLLIFSGNVTTLATVSRELWAFSRDRGFPFSRWISHVCYFSTPYQVLALILLSLADEPQIRHPLQRSLPFLLRYRCPLPHQSRLNARLQHHRFPISSCPHVHLHDFHRMRTPQAHQRRATTPRTLESRKIRNTHQRFCFLLQCFHHRL